MPIFAINSPRLDNEFEDVVVAPGNGFVFVVQQLAAGIGECSKLLDMK